LETSIRMTCGGWKRVLEWRIAIHPLQVIGSSLLFVYDSSNQNSVHMIDFGKTIEVPPGIRVDFKVSFHYVILGMTQLASH